MAILPYHKGSKVNAVRHKYATLIVAAASVLSVATPGAPVFAGEVSFKSFPYLIYCQYRGIDHGYYFSQLGTDGRAIYITPDRQAGTITINGVAERVGGRRSGSCLDKTLADLRSAGQAFDLPH